VTGTATFGDFAAAASNHLARAVSLTDPVATSRSGAGRVTQAADIRRGMSRVITVISRYVADITASTARVRPDQHEVLTPWARAAVEAAKALKEASALLAPDGGRVFGSNMRPSASAAGQGFDAAISFMTAGRDLLHTHLSADLDRTRVYRSEWAPVIVSVPVTGALMLEFAQWAQVSATGGRKAAEIKPPRERRVSDSIEALVAQRRLEAASRALLKVHAAVHRAQRRQPVSLADVGLLHAIRANVVPAHRPPVGWESVADLCRGTTETAERARHIARVVVPDALWSPLLTGDSLRETAASATAVSHHCSIVLRTLGARTAQQGSAAVSAGLFQSAAAAERARDAWLRAATMWKQLTTETRGVTSTGHR